MTSIKAIEEISSASSIRELHGVILKFLHDFDLNDFAYVVKIPSINSNEIPFVLSGYQKSWSEHYINNRYDLIDPTISLGFQNIAPLSWSDISYDSVKTFRDESKDAGLLYGYTYPIRGCHGEKAIFCISSNKSIPIEAYLYVNAIVPFIHQKIIDLELKNRLYFRIPYLTEKEKAFIKWLAIGKTMEEISIIMNISYRTCADYSEKIKNKLNCTSRNQIISLVVSKNLVEL